MAKRGPKTAAGRNAVRFNAVQHGVLSLSPVIAGLEREEDWQAHRASILASLAPEGQLEAALAERVALALWRLHRATRYERDTVTTAQELAEQDVFQQPPSEREFLFNVLDSILRRQTDGARSGQPAAGEGLGPLTEKLEAKLLEPVSVEEAHTFARDARTLADLVERLPHLPENTSLAGYAAAFILETAAAKAKVDLEEVHLRGVPEDSGAWADWTEWTAGIVRHALQAIADQAELELDDVLDIVDLVARTDALLKEKKARDLQARLDRLRRERLLPDDATLQKLMRYETHLNRQLYQALHELEALQSRRRGDSPPLARLDVHGIPEA